MPRAKTIEWHHSTFVLGEQPVDVDLLRVAPKRIFCVFVHRARGAPTPAGMVARRKCVGNRLPWVRRAGLDAVLGTADAPSPGAPQRGESPRARVALGVSATRTPFMHLRITESGSASRDFVVGPGDVTVGRSLDCDVVLQQSFVSGRHLRLIDGLVVEDLGLDERDVPRRSQDRAARSDRRPTTVDRRQGPDAGVRAPHQGSSRALVAEELETLRRRIDTLERASSTGGATPPRRIPTRLPTSDEWSHLLLELVNNDAPRHEPAKDISVTEFYIIESFKLVRNVETFVTRLAGELVRQFGAGTILPGSDRDHNLRNLLSDIIIDPESSEHRDAFLEYQNHLQTWLVVSFNAYKDGSLALVKELRESLRPNVLRRQEPIPRWFGLSSSMTSCCGGGRRRSWTSSRATTSSIASTVSLATQRTSTSRARRAGAVEPSLTTPVSSGALERLGRAELAHAALLAPATPCPLLFRLLSSGLRGSVPPVAASGLVSAGLRVSAPAVVGSGLVSAGLRGSVPPVASCLVSAGLRGSVPPVVSSRLVSAGLRGSVPPVVSSLLGIASLAFQGCPEPATGGTEPRRPEETRRKKRARASRGSALEPVTSSAERHEGAVAPGTRNQPWK